MENKFSFGIGCFHFGVKKKPPFKFEGSEYVKELHAALESISNIDNINIDCDDEFMNSSIDLSEELPNIMNGSGYFPHPLFMHIDFEVYIPFRIQAQLLKTEVPFVETFTEKFKISIHHTYHFPVTFVEPIHPSQESEPSEAVQIIREFLKQEFKSSKSDYIQFECLGPSPFHANCYIQPRENKDDVEVDWRFEAERLPKKGYDVINFYFNPRIFANPEKAKKVILEEIQDELGFFYSIVEFRVEKIHDWERIQGLLDQLVFMQQMRGIKYFLKVFARSRLINEVFTSMAQFESKELIGQNINQKDYRSIYFGKEKRCFKYYVNKEMKDDYIYPTKEMNQLISFFESRRAKSMEMFVVLISASIGGGIGALLAILLSK